MAQNLPWNLRGVDPSVRDAIKAAARKAGLSVAEWLERVSREEARQSAALSEEREEAADINSRLRRLSRSTSDAALGRAGAVSQRDLEALVSHAAMIEARARDTESRTASALETIVTWIERTEARMAETERTAAERQELTTSVIADAIKTVSSRVSDVERRSEERLAGAAREQQGLRRAETGRQAAMAAQDEIEPRMAMAQGQSRPRPRPVLSRENLAAAVSDIRSRQRDLDAPARSRSDGETMGAVLPFGERRTGERRAEVTPLMNELRADLAQLREEIGRLSSQASPRIEESLRELSRSLETRAPAPQVDELARPLARIEAEIARLRTSDQTERFARIEEELQHLGGRIEGLAAAAHEPRVLSAAIKEISGLKQAISQAGSPPRIDEIGDQIGRMAADLARVRESGRQELEQAVSDMRDALSRETREMNGISHGLLQRIAAQLDNVARTVADMPGGGMGDSERAEVAALSRRLDQLALRTEPESDELARKIEMLAIKLDDLSQPGSNELIERIERLSEQIETLNRRGPGAIERQIDALAARIETIVDSRKLEAMTQPQGGPIDFSPIEAAIQELSARMDAAGRLPAAPPSAPVDLGPIETMIADLARRMEEASSPQAGDRQLQALERQIARLTERIERQPAPQASDGALERTLQDLMRSLGGLREETSTAVDRAARAAAEGVISRAQNLSGSGGLEGLAGLRQDLAGLKDIHHSIDQRTSTTLSAVNDTLETIMRRIGQIETEIARERPDEVLVQRPAPATGAPTAAAAAPSPAPAAMPRRVGERGASRAVARFEDPPLESPAPARRETAEPPAQVPLDLADMPLEPGSGRPGARGETAPPAQPAATALAPAAASSLNPSLIAAARRAAQAATAEAAALKSQDGKKGEKSAKAKGGLALPSTTSLKEILEKRRKPILLGLAAIVLAIGAGQVANTLLEGSSRPAPAQRTAEPVASAPVPAPRAETEPAAAEPTVPGDQRSLSTRPLGQTPILEATGSIRPPAAQPNAGAPASRAAQPAAEAQQPDVAALPPPAASGAEPQAILPGRVTNLGEIPAGLGTPGMRRAAQEGDANAVFELASRAADGVGTARDQRLALRLFERAAAAGFAPAQFRLGNIYEKGLGAARDAKLAVSWYRRAADRGNAKAMHNLAVLLAEGADGRPDFAAAADLFRKAAEFGVRDSQFNLAILLGRGLGLEQDLTQAFFWFSVAAQDGDADAGKKRDEVGARLQAADLAAARSMALNWRAKTPDPIANEATAPAGGWDPQQRSQPRPQQPKPRTS